MTTQTAPAEPAILSSKQKKYLKGLAHPLPAIIQLGKEGLSSRAITATSQQLLHHELIKVKIGTNSGLEKNATALALASATDSQLVQLIGKTIVLYRENPERPKETRIRLPIL